MKGSAILTDVPAHDQTLLWCARKCAAVVKIARTLIQHKCSVLKYDDKDVEYDLKII